MEPPEELRLKNASQGTLKRGINNVDPPEVKTHHLINYDDFNFSDFQFKPRKKKSSQVTNDVVPVLPIAILECPLCGCKSKTDTAKARHLKECTKKRGISFAKMQEAVELQKKQAEERRLAGFPILSSKPVREPRRNTAIKRQLEPQTSLQADLQMAVAMSLSLQQKRNKEEDQERFFLEALTGESESEDKKLITALKISSTSDEKLEAPLGRKIRRKKQGITPFWLVRSKEETKMIRAERVVKILSEQATDSDEENCPFILNWETIRQHCTIPWPSAGYCRLWEAAMLPETVRSDSNKFYVKSLEHWFPPKEIQTPKMQKKQPSFNTQKRRKKDEIECLPSTLAALDALNANASFLQNDISVEAGLDGFLLDNTYGDGFFTQVQKKERMHLDISSQVVERLLNMVNNDTLGDVEIIIKNDEVIHCHKFILYINCPEAYQELVKNADPVLIWTDISHEGAITFLQFVYGGIFTGSNKKEMHQLAVRYQIQELLNLLSNAESSNDDHDHLDEPLSVKLTSSSGSNSPMSVGRFSPSPILKSNKQLSGSRSPVLTGGNRNSKSVPREFTERSAHKILNESLHREELINSAANLSNRMIKHSGRFDLRCKNSRTPYRKLSLNGSSMMSPDLFSSVQDQEQKTTAEVATDNESIRIASKRERIDKPLEISFANLCSPICNFTPKTATSTPLENMMLLSSKNAKTFSISPVLAEQSVCLQSSQCIEPKHLLGIFKCGKTSCSKTSESCIISDTPESNLQDACNLSHNGSMDKIYNVEESWENFNYESESDRSENRPQMDGGLKSSLESLVLESLHNASGSEEKDVLGHLRTSGKRKLALTSLTSNSSSKRMKQKLGLNNNSRLSTTSRMGEAKQSLDVQMLQLSNDSLPNPECELQAGNAASSPSPDRSLKFASTPISTKSVENSFEHNSTWNDFPEGYYSDDNIHSVDGSLPNLIDQQDLGRDIHSLTPRKGSQLSASPIGSPLASPGINPRINTEHAATHDKCSELLENVTSFGSQDSIWDDELDDHFNNGEVSQPDSDLPDIDPCPLIHESLHLEEVDYVTKYAPVGVSPSSTPTKKMFAKKKRKLSKKLPKEMCVTPMPHYSIMETPLIKKELKKIGVRALPKKKGVMVLKHVYMETHPEGTSHASKEKPNHPKSPSLVEDLASSMSAPENGLGLNESYNSISKDEVRVKKTKLSSKSKKKVVKTEDTLEIPKCRSQSREKRTSPIKSTLEKEGNKQAWSAFSNEELKAFIFVNAELRARIVNYKPIDFKHLHSDMKAAGLKPTVQELQDFLDDQCITYTSLEELSPRKSKKRTCRRGKKQQ